MSPTTTKPRSITSPIAPIAIGPYSQDVAHGNLVFISGQLPIDPVTDAIVDGAVAEQTRQVLDNIEAILKSEGITLDDVVKTTILLVDLADFTAVNATYAARFSGDVLPARSTFQVAGLPKGALVEIEAIAVIRS